MTIRRRLRSRRRNTGGQGGGGGTPSTERPWTLLQRTGDYSPSGLRTRLANSATMRQRWQDTVTAFEHADGDWMTMTPGAGLSELYGGTIGIAAFFAAVRTSSDDLGITWQRSWASYVSTCVQQAVHYATSATSFRAGAVGCALVYDLLFDHISDGDRTTLHNFINTVASGGQFINGRWDDQKASDHIGTTLCILAHNNDTYVAQALLESQDWATARYHVNQRTDGYEWKQGYPTNAGIPFCLWILKQRLGLTDAETVDKCAYHLQHAIPLLIRNTIPHPGRAQPMRARFGMSEPLAEWYDENNVATYFLWAFALLPGKLSLDATQDIRGHASFAIANQATLAASEDAYLGYLRWLWNLNSAAYATHSNWRYSRWASTEVTRPYVQALFSLIPWLLLDVQLPATVEPATAGIPKVMRWWPGTYEQTEVRSDLTIANSTGSVMTVWHPKTHINNYEGSSRHCGSWQIHRAGPGYIHRSCRGHGTAGRHITKMANGTVSLVPTADFPRYTLPWSGTYAAGGQRIGGANCDYWDFSAYRTPGTNVLANEAINGHMGTVDGWFADSKVVVQRDNLKNAYNNDVYRMTADAENDPVTTAYTRDTVIIQRGADGTTREKLITYDRIATTSTGIEPRYNINPGPPQHTYTGGTETANAGWAPQGSVPDIGGKQLVESGAGQIGDGRTPAAWFASGPTEWEITGASNIIFDNRTEPSTSTSWSAKTHTVVGEGKFCTTPLIGGNASAPTAWKIKKTGGLTATRNDGGSPFVVGDTAPIFGEYHGWHFGDEDDWDPTDSKGHTGTGQRAYVGLYTLQIIPDTVVTDTRYLIANEAMSWDESPSTHALVTCDAAHVAARVGNTVVIFAKVSTAVNTGNVDIPAGVTLVVWANLTPNQLRTFTPTGGIAISSKSGDGTASNTGAASGVVWAVTDGTAGNIAWS